MAIARLFLLRVPSEGIPLEWDGEHSRVQASGKEATIMLTRRKNCQLPTVLKRECCCASSGRRLCAVHWIAEMQAQQGSGRIFSLSASRFLTIVRHAAWESGIPEYNSVGTHAFRRGVAQDINIIDAGGSLAVLLRAGEWNSSAFLAYLRQSQPQEVAVAQAVINLSDSEEDI